MKVLILAGGLGTRISEETDVRPRPMGEIGGKHILWHTMKIYSRYSPSPVYPCMVEPVTMNDRERLITTSHQRIRIITTLTAPVRSGQNRDDQPGQSTSHAVKGIHHDNSEKRNSTQSQYRHPHLQSRRPVAPFD